MSKFQIYQDKRGEYRWRFIAKNNKIIGVSSEGYKNRSSCQHGIELMKKYFLDQDLPPPQSEPPHLEPNHDQAYDVQADKERFFNGLQIKTKIVPKLP